jgi:histidine triad (HIT) family protein
MSNCIFCQIVAGQIPAKLLHQDEFVIAFADIAPQAPTHILVIPRQHLESLNALGPEDNALIGRMFTVATGLARQQGIAERGYRTVINTHRDGGQSVDHLHLHLLGGRTMTWPPG